MRWWLPSPDLVKQSFILTLSNYRNQLSCYSITGSTPNELWKVTSQDQAPYKDADCLIQQSALCTWLALVCPEEVEFYALAHQKDQGKSMPKCIGRWKLPDNFHGRKVLFGKRTTFGKLFVLVNSVAHNNMSKSSSLGSLSTSLSNLPLTKKPIGSSYLLIYNVPDDSGVFPLQKQMKLYHKPISAAVLSSDGVYLAFGTSDGSINVMKWSSDSSFYSVLCVKNLHQLSVASLAFDSASTFLASGSPDQVLAVISMKACRDPKFRIVLATLLRIIWYYIMAPLLILIMIVLWNSS